MKRERLAPDDALTQGKQLPFVYLRELSRVYFGPNIVAPVQEEVIEARFFDKEQEIRVFRSGEKLCGARLAAEPGDRQILQQFDIANPVFGKSFSVCHTLEADEDGQSYIASTRLTGWKGGA